MQGTTQWRQCTHDGSSPLRVPGHPSNAEAKRQASPIIASEASVRKSLDRFSAPLAARMYEAILILDGASSFVNPTDGAVGPAQCPATRPNHSVVIPLARCGCSRIVIHPREEAPAIADASSTSIVA